MSARVITCEVGASVGERVRVSVCECECEC